MLFNFKKITMALASVAMIGGLAISIGRSNYQTEATFSGDTIVFLDKTSIIPSLGWWQTDSTYIHIWDGTVDIYQQMNKINNNLFSFTIASLQISRFTDDSRGFEFYVYDRSNQQNQTVFVGGSTMVTNEYNYFKITSANGGAKQTLSSLKAIDETKTSIFNLSCSSTSNEMQWALDQYGGLSSSDKTNVKTTYIVPETTTYFDRLDYLAIYHNKTRPV